MGSFQTTFGGTLGILAALAFSAFLCCGGFAWMAERGRRLRDEPPVKRITRESVSEQTITEPEPESIESEAPAEPVRVPDPQRMPISNEQKAASKLSAAKSFISAGKKDSGRKWLREIVDQWPETEAAREAERLLRH